MPDEEFCEGVSHPIARELPSGPWRSAKSWTVCCVKRLAGFPGGTRSGLESKISAEKRSTSGTFEKSPA